ncbi:hypothetical protein XA68_10634 [Ophiocordyceps unilateralis]|uniref:Uncharacterized protein n=1 Tax=Ophiocordyceps unilateralis TaxID=268505 RepID=A0A2A9PIB2_OPHUN|nr:hypothetical protein XA68_10634 [Ophiocordyceps unilateralis]
MARALVASQRIKAESQCQPSCMPHPRAESASHIVPTSFRDTRSPGLASAGHSLSFNPPPGPVRSAEQSAVSSIPTCTRWKELDRFFFFFPQRRQHAQHRQRRRPSLDSQAAQAEALHALKAAPETSRAPLHQPSAQSSSNEADPYRCDVVPLAFPSSPLDAIPPPSRSPPGSHVGSEPTRPSHPAELLQKPCLHLKTRPGSPPPSTANQLPPATTPVARPSPLQAPIYHCFRPRPCSLHWPSSSSGDNPRLRRPALAINQRQQSSSSRRTRRRRIARRTRYVQEEKEARCLSAASQPSRLVTFVPGRCIRWFANLAIAYICTTWSSSSLIHSSPTLLNECSAPLITSASAAWHPPLPLGRLWSSGQGTPSQLPDFHPPPYVLVDPTSLSPRARGLFRRPALGPPFRVTIVPDGWQWPGGRRRVADDGSRPLLLLRRYWNGCTFPSCSSGGFANASQVWLQAPTTSSASASATLARSPVSSVANDPGWIDGTPRFASSRLSHTVDNARRGLHHVGPRFPTAGPSVGPSALSAAAATSACMYLDRPGRATHFYDIPTATTASTSTHFR